MNDKKENDNSEKGEKGYAPTRRPPSKEPPYQPLPLPPAKDSK